MKTYFILLLLIFCQIVIFSSIKLTKVNKNRDFLKLNGKQGLPPLTLDEFQFRLITNMFNGIQYERLEMDNDNKLLTYQNGFSFNKMIKCHWGQHIVLASKMLFQAISVKIRSFQFIDKYNLKPIIMDFQEIKKNVNFLLAIGYNMICHKQIPNVELRVDPDYYQIEQNLRNAKHQFHENVLILMLSILHDELNTLNMDPNQPINGILNQYFIEIEDFWKLKQQDPEYLKTFFDEIRNIFLAIQAVTDKKQLEIFDEKWGRILGEFSRAFLMLKLGFQSQITISELKKRGSTFYDRIKILSRQLYKVQQTEKILLFSHLADSIAGIYIVAQNWVILFEEENFAGKQKNQKNFNHYDFYIQAEEENMNYKVCNFLADFQEILVIQQQIIDSLSEYTFTDEQMKPQFENYKPALDEIYMKICMGEAFQCLESLYHPFNLKKIVKVINKIDINFIKKLANLRRTGYISDIRVSQSIKEEEILTNMGYIPFFSLSDNSLILWTCKMCGGGSVVTQLKFQKITDSPHQDLTQHFLNIVKQPDKTYTVLQIFKYDVLIIEKTIIGIVDSQYEVSLNEIFFDETDSNDVWKNLNFKIDNNFIINFNVWDNEKYDWQESDYPKHLSGHREIELVSFGIVTPNVRTCKEYLIAEIERIEMEGFFQERKYIMWNYKMYKEFSQKEFSEAEFNDFLLNVKAASCQITTQFDQTANAPNVIISADDKAYYDKQMKLNKKWLFIEKVPEFVLYTAYKWLYPFKDVDLNSMVSFDEMRQYLLEERNIVQREIQKVICEKGATFCTFLDTPYELQIEKIAGKFQNQLNIVDPEFDFVSTKCKKLKQQLPKYDVMNITTLNRILGDFAGDNEIVKQIIDEECDFKQIYQFQFPCGRKDRKYLTFDGEMHEHCYEEIEENMHEIEREISIDQRITIQRDYFLLIQITRDGNYLHTDGQKIKEMGYNYMATWLKFPRIESKSINNKKYFTTFQVFVRIDPIKHNFIGLVDQFHHIDCMINNNYFLRWVHSTPSVFSDDSYQFRLEKALQHSIQPIRLTNLKFHLGLLQQGNEKWETFCGETGCQWARVFIPVKYQGDPQQSCGEEFAVKSLKYFNNFLGLSETCDGKKMPINSVYYLELVFTNDPSLEVYKTVSEIDLNIAKKQGYIPMNTKIPITYSFNGVSTVIRLWVKPKANILNYRRFLCEKYIEEEDIFPVKQERDIWTRVVVESYYENNC